ncbi:MAG TPA: amino acid permease [Gammaproteobacteria bacterium]|nr:amino acid permease [Gammaproteobacteria bacterium]
MNLFRTKPIDANAATGLRKVLGPVDLTLMGIGCIIGAGIFVLTGQAAALHAGPAIVISFGITGLACAFSALSYAELASSIGGCGSAYGYGYASLGEIIGWIIGWDLLLEYGLGVATVAVGWSGYVSDAIKSIGFTIPYGWTHAPGVCAPIQPATNVMMTQPLDNVVQTAQQCGGVNAPAIIIILLLAVLLAVGVKESARFNAVMVGIKLLALLLFIALAVTKLNPDFWHPFIPPVGPNPLGHTAYGWGGIMSGAAVIFFAYIGFDSVATAAEETKNPQRNVPIGILSSLVVCTVLYMIVSALLTGIVPFKTLNVASPVAKAILDIGYNWGAAAVAIGAIAGLSTVMLVLFFGLTRILLAMSRDGLLPNAAARVSKKTGTPVRIIFILGVILAAIAGFTPIDILATLVNIGTLAAFTVVCVGVIVLRYKKPDMPRPFKTPLTPLLPALGALINIYIAAHLPGRTWIAFVVWLVIGLCVYFLYSYKHSELHEPAKDAA